MIAQIHMPSLFVHALIVNLVIIVILLCQAPHDLTVK